MTYKTEDKKEENHPRNASKELSLFRLRIQQCGLADAPRRKSSSRYINQEKEKSKAKGCLVTVLSSPITVAVGGYLLWNVCIP